MKTSLVPVTVALVAACGLVFLSGTAFIATPVAPAASLSARNLGLGRSYLQSADIDEASGASGNNFLAACSIGSLLLAAGVAAARRGGITRYAATPKKLQLEQIPRPEDLLESPRFPLFAGNTSGYFSRATRERHAITWTSKEESYFEMPTGGFAYMNKGENLCYFRKKEQCICLCKALKKKKINDVKIYRIKKDGTVIFMHPLDGVWPENSCTGRPLVNWRPFTCGQNPNPAELKWTKYHQKAYEVDPLSSMFVRARAGAFVDQESVFPLPQVGIWMEKDSKEYEEYTKKMSDLVKSLPPLPKSL